MQLPAPNLAPKIELADTNGSLVHIGTGNRMLLSFFRDTHCPFCNFRIFQLTQHYKEFSEAGLDIVIFFLCQSRHISRTNRVIRHAFSRHPMAGETLLFDYATSDTSPADRQKKGQHVPSLETR